jgi:hypothetical protein
MRLKARLLTQKSLIRNRKTVEVNNCFDYQRSNAVSPNGAVRICNVKPIDEENLVHQSLVCELLMARIWNKNATLNPICSHCLGLTLVHQEQQY